MPLAKPFANFPLDKIVEVQRLAREGFSVREICRRVGTHHHNVRPIVAELEAAGELPTHCPCGQLRGAGHRNLACSVSTAPKLGYPKRRASQLGWTKIKDIYRRVDAGQSNRSIAIETGISLTAVNKHSKIWMEKRGRPLPPCRCGRPARHPGGCVKNSPSLLSRDRIKRIEQWARDGLSAAEMQRRSRVIADGGDLRAILKYATPVWEAMAAEGIYCGCGKRRGHVGLCAATWSSRGRIRGPQPVPVEEQVRIVNALLSGDSIPAIRRTVEVSEKKVLRIFRAMTAEERHKRAVIVHRRIGDDDGHQHGLDLYERVRAVVPATLEISIRDEVISELCLAVLQHDLTLDDIKQHAKKFVGRAFTTWASGFGPRSLDEAINEDGDRALHDIIGDDTGADHLGDFAIGGDW